MTITAYLLRGCNSITAVPVKAKEDRDAVHGKAAHRLPGADVFEGQAASCERGKGMRTKAEVLQPDKVEISVTIVMRLCDWDELKKQLKDVWPGSELSRHISEVIYKTKREVLVMPCEEE